MAASSETDLKKLAREIFGREITDEQARLYQARLPNMARAKAALQDWESRLGEIEPMTVSRVLEPVEASHDNS